MALVPRYAVIGSRSWVGRFAVVDCRSGDAVGLYLSKSAADEALRSLAAGAALESALAAELGVAVPPPPPPAPWPARPRVRRSGRGVAPRR